MRVEELKPREHGTEEEIRFALSVLQIIREAGYTGLVELIGSRATGEYISRKALQFSCEALSEEQQKYWRDYLNREAKTQNLSRRKIPELIQTLPDSTPESIKQMLVGIPLGDFKNLQRGQILIF